MEEIRHRERCLFYEIPIISQNYLHASDARAEVICVDKSMSSAKENMHQESDSDFLCRLISSEVFAEFEFLQRLG